MSALQKSIDSWLPPVCAETNLGKLATILPLLDWDPIDQMLQSRLQEAAQALTSAYRCRVRSVRARQRYLFTYLELFQIEAPEEDPLILGAWFTLATRASQSLIRVEGDISGESSGDVLFRSTPMECLIDPQTVASAAVSILEELLAALPRASR